MAITPVSNPDTVFNITYEGIEFEFTSNTANIFQLRSDVYVGGVYVVTLNAPVEFGTTNEFKFNLSDILRNHVAYSHETSVSGHDVKEATASTASFQIKVFEVYLSGGVVTTAWTDDQLGTPDHTSASYIAHQTALNPFEVPNDYNMKIGDPKPFLSLREATSNLMSGEFMQLDFITGVTTVDFNVDEYDSSGALIASNTTASYAVINARGKAVIDGSTLDALTKSIVVWVDDNSGGTRISDLLTIKIIPNCGNSPVIIHWGNHLGGMEQYHFDKRQTKTRRSSHINIRRGATELIENVTGNRSTVYDVFSDIDTDSAYEFLNEIPSNSKNTNWLRSGTMFPIIVSGGRGTKKFSDTEQDIDTYKLSFEMSKKTQVIRG